MSREQHDLKREALTELMRMSKAAGGKITAEDVVKAAEQPDSALHEYFEWRDDIAAQKYRLVQARTLIRACHYQVTIQDRKVELPYYTRDPEVDSMTQGYVEVARVRGQDDIAREVLIREFQRAAAQLKRARDMASFFGMTEEVDRMIDMLGIMRERILQPEAMQ